MNKRIVLALIIGVLPVRFIHCQTKPDIDLLNGTINGHAIRDLTTDAVTDLFGRPSGTAESSISGKYELGSMIAYSDLGLIFRFVNPHSDPGQHLSGVIVYFLPTTNEPTHTTLRPFSGILSHQINGDWKSKRVLDEFAAFGPVNDYDAKEIENTRKLRDQLKAMGQDHYSDVIMSTISNSAVIHFRTPRTYVVISYDEQTKFLTQVEVDPIERITPAPESSPVAQTTVAPPATNATAPPASSSDPLGSTTVGGYFAATSEAVLDQAISDSATHDTEALQALINAGSLIVLKGGVRVQIVDTKSFYGKVKVRPVGSNSVLWTVREAIH